MWTPVEGAFFGKREPLVHAETVLLIHDYQPETGKAHIRLKECVGTDNQMRFTGGQPRQRRAALCTLQPAAEPLEFYPQRFEPRLEALPVLFPKQFSRCHQSHLKPVVDGLQGDARRDQCFAGANVALHQSQHRCGPAEVGGHFCQHTALGTGGGEGQCCEKLFQYARPQRQGRSALALLFLPQAQ